MHVTRCKMCGEKFCPSCGNVDEGYCVYCGEDDGENWDDE